MTRAVIWGGENFVAVKLAGKLKEQGIKVIKGDYEEIPDNTAYFFDFVGKEESWHKIRDKQKLVLIRVNSKDEKEWEDKLKETKLNWRIVVGENVYGEGMEETGFLGRALMLAARNKNLVLPSLDQIYRVLAADDMVEAILRACFFSGTQGRVLLVGGREINSKIIAEILVDEAKMTKIQVIQDENKVENLNTNLVELTYELLRWQPEVTFKEGVKEVVQYFVAKIDQENRKKNSKKTDYMVTQVKREAVEKRYEVEIENEPKEEIEIEIEEEEEEKKEKKMEEREKKEEKKGDKEFVIESLKKSPLPERMETKEIETEIIEEEKKEKKEINEVVKEKEGGKIKWLKWVIWLMVWSFLVVFLVNVIKMVSLPKKISGVVSLIEEGKYEEAKKEIKYLSENNTEWLKLVGWGKSGTLLRAEGEVVDLLGYSIDLAQSGEKIRGAIFGEKEIEMKTELGVMEKNLDEIISKIGILEGRLSGQWGWLPGRYREKLNQMREKLATERGRVENIRKTIPILPEILGLDGKRREYMVLLQNENELRATGGFIGSYAILTFEGGQWKGFEVNDIYEADGQLKGHVEPPNEIKKYLGEAAWFMRDANWQASFPLASKDIQWFLEKETGRKVDGVIGLNLAAVKAILGVSGEIYIPDFKEKVNQDNLYEEAEYYSENKFFAGSVQKASFLGAVSKQLVEEIKLAKGAKGQKLLLAILDLLEENEIQVAVNETKTAENLAEMGWDGSIYDGKCNGDKCLADYLFIVESNLGVNKANYFIYRNIERQIEIKEKSVENTLMINYENTAKNNSWPAGNYKNYIRIYLPKETIVEEISWSEKDGGEKKIIGGDDLKNNLVNNKREVGFLTTVAVGKKVKVEVKYRENIDLSNLQKFSYLNYIQKQSGYGNTGIVTLISVPEGWQVMAVEPTASVVGGKLLFNQKLEKDIKMGVEISR